MKKEKTIEELNKKLHKLEKFNEKAIPLFNKCEHWLGILVILSLLLRFIFPVFAIVKNILLGLLVALSAANMVIDFVDVVDKMDKIYKQIEDLKEKENMNTTNDLVKDCSQERKLVVEKTNNLKEMKGYSRTKAMKVYAYKVKELENEETENSLN